MLFLLDLLCTWGAGAVSSSPCCNTSLPMLHHHVEAAQQFANAWPVGWAGRPAVLNEQPGTTTASDSNENVKSN